jgi:hypothetical protein
MTPSFSTPERNPMTPLQQKMNQLTLATMSRHVETTLTEAAAKNLSVSATLEWLADMELEARKRRAIEGRYKCSRLQAQPSIDAFLFQHCNGSRSFPSKFSRYSPADFSDSRPSWAVRGRDRILVCIGTAGIPPPRNQKPIRSARQKRPGGRRV